MLAYSSAGDILKACSTLLVPTLHCCLHGINGASLRTPRCIFTPLRQWTSMNASSTQQWVMQHFQACVSNQTVFA